jgi:2-oxo-3-hexenedioate decarboxylase
MSGVVDKLTPPLVAGEPVSSGSLAEAPPIAPGQTWTATLEGIDLSELTLTTTA